VLVVVVRYDRLFVARGRISYWEVPHPLPRPFRKSGTRASIEAEHMTLVFPVSISTEPSAKLRNEGMTVWVLL
jgi:hypothetical protein